MNPFRLLIDELERLRAPCLLGGAHASSVRGIPRATMDVDLVADIEEAQAGPLATALGRNWYAEPSQMRDAIRRGQPFSVVFIPTAEKFDIFPAASDFDKQQLQRATRETANISGTSVECPVATAEDILLAKLQWYRIRGETSETQWNDIQGIIEVNPGIDSSYLSAWAARLRVTDLLERALAESRSAEQH